MKCPKCGYSSFDHNEACPKCNKDMMAERERMNLPSYEPNPPSLLTALIGEDYETSVDIEIQSPDDVEALEQEGVLSPEDSQTIEAMEEAFKDSQELEMEIETGPDEKLEDLEETGPPQEEPAVTLSMEADQDQQPATLPVEGSGEGPSLDLEDLAMEDSPIESERKQPGGDIEPGFALSEGIDVEKTVIFESTETEEGTESFEIEDISLEDTDAPPEEKTAEKPAEGTLVDLEELSLMVEDLSEEDKEPESAPAPKEEKVAEEGFSLDLETLEIDLDLDNHQDKST